MRREAREKTTQKRKQASEQQAQQAQAQQDRASAILSAGARGYSQRRQERQKSQETSNSAVRIQAKFRGKKERDPTSEASVRRLRKQNDPNEQASEYLEKHKILELFDMLGQMVISDKPSDPRAFLASQLEVMSASTDFTSPRNFFSDAELDTLYAMYDVSKGGMTRAQCREALNAIGLEAVALPDGASRFDAAAFKALGPAIQ